MPKATVHFCLPEQPASGRPRRWWLSDFFDDNVTVTADPNADFVVVLQHESSLKLFAQGANPGQVRIYWGIEAVTPNFNVFDYAIGFDRLTLGDRYARMHPLTSMSRFLSVESLLDGDAPAPTVRPPRFCDYIYSNGGAHAMRARLFHRLSEYRTVDSYGSHLNNTDDRILRTTWDNDWCTPKMDLHKEHSFSLAIENSLHRGYTTEKLATAFIAGTMPIYWGNPDVGLDFNTERFVNVHDYATIDAVVQRVRELDADDDLMQEALSRPALTDEQLRHYRDADEELRAFLHAIFGQDLDAAARRAEGPQQRMQEEAFIAQALGLVEPQGPRARWSLRRR
jgi:hypothetical protein